MTVGDLKEYLNNFDDRAKVYYLDKETADDFPLEYCRLDIIDDYGES